MAESQLAIARRMVECLNARDWEALSRLVAEDFEWHTARGIRSSRTLHGVSELRTWWETDVGESWDLSRSRDEVVQAEDAEGGVILRTRSVDYGRSSGVRTESERGVIVTFAGDRIQSFRVFLTVEDARRAAGLAH